MVIATSGAIYYFFKEITLSLKDDPHRSRPKYTSHDLSCRTLLFAGIMDTDDLCISGLKSTD